LKFSGLLGLDFQASEPGAVSDIGWHMLGTVYISQAGENSNMASIWQKFKVGLLIGLLYVVYYLIRSSRALKRLQIPRISWGIKSWRQYVVDLLRQAWNCYPQAAQATGAIPPRPVSTD